ncbi:cobyrinic acid a,c-diamide synthase [Monaibacterium marinum]|uniref:Hydrogenobyrinate a,c-diamide synthase n=1 Tax=Pontivivens marinum TaxID=1690039 RepID=A0A2C9CSN5_9RHOB|nr:cobyrinate a,c-diamide synthase [Monaibacterium marinum]SOH94262.1 cobyrinic acid a,c-diamide synthase [Monaibacterium marinum]
MSVAPGLMISAPASGTGKTTLMLGLLRAYRDAGLTVQAFKSGPDYIDPAFHHAASGRPSYNLDTWSMDAPLLNGLSARAQGADLVLAEGSMGLFDGVPHNGRTGTGASADMAQRNGWPVVLVIDVSGQAQSAAATALGFRSLRPDMPFAGVVLNRVASPRHERLIRDGMQAAGITVFGSLPRNKSTEMPERHLGLVQALEHEGIDTLLDDAAQFVRDNVDLDALRAAAGSVVSADAAPMPTVVPPGQRIALAQDAAFSFVYPHIMEGWRAAGAEILPFSPLADQAPDASADVVWLPGGYPELHAGTIAAAKTYLSGLRDFAQTKPVHGECGGYMAMGQALIDKDGVRHEMAGLLGLVTSYQKRKMHLGYRMATLPNGQKLRGHEFHYSSILEQPDAPLADVTDANGQAVPETGSQRGHASGTFFHLIAAETA